MAREIEFGGYIEFLESFTYREEDAINIPKRIREVAFSLQVDVEIVSTIGNDYKNFKVSPPSSFYGYAVLVFRGFADIEIPIKQARQRLYYGKNDAAYSQWEALHHHRQNRVYRNEQIVAFGTFWGAAGLEDYPLIAESCPLWLGFEELPLREVYVECAYGTQFKLHVSYWQPFTGAFDDGCIYDAKSGQADRDEDNNPNTDEEGLPSDGVQPNRANDPANPYAGLPPVSLPSEEGEFSNSKIANMDDTNPDNDPDSNIPATSTTKGYYMLVRGGFVGALPNCGVSPWNYIVPCTNGSSIEVVVLNPSSVFCDKIDSRFRVRDGATIFFTSTNVWMVLPITGEIKYGLLPSAFPS